MGGTSPLELKVADPVTAEAGKEDVGVIVAETGAGEETVKAEGGRSLAVSKEEVELSAGEVKPAVMPAEEEMKDDDIAALEEDIDALFLRLIDLVVFKVDGDGSVCVSWSGLVVIHDDVVTVGSVL